MSRECLCRAPSSLAAYDAGLSRFSRSGTNILLLLLLKAKFTVHSMLLLMLLCLRNAYV